MAAGKYVLISILGFLSYCLKVCNYTIGLSLIARDDDDDDDFAGWLACLPHSVRKILSNESRKSLILVPRVVFVQ